LIVLAASVGAQGSELKPVESVLAQINETSSSEAQGSSTSAGLLKDIQAFRARSARLAEATAATEWLGLWERSLTVAARSDDYEAFDASTQAQVGPRSVLAALPSPASWRAIHAQASIRAAAAPEQVSALGLRLVSELLLGDALAAGQTLNAFEKLAASSGASEQERKRWQINEARSLLYKLYGTREQISEAFRAALDASVTQGHSSGVEVPDLVGLLGADKAEALLVEALKQPVLLSVPAGEATRTLARKLALRELGKLRKPQWALVDSMGNSELYEALQVRFAAASESSDAELTGESDFLLDFSRRTASVYYFLDLVSQGRHREAELALARASGRNSELNVSREAMGELVRRGKSQAVFAFLNDLLERKPQLSVWNFHLEQAGATGHSQEALALLDRVLKRADLTPALRESLTERRVDALLGADQIEPAVEILRQALSKPPTSDDPRLQERTDAALRLAAMGRVLQRPEWARTGLDFAKQATKLPRFAEGAWSRLTRQKLLIELRQQGQLEAAQALSIEALQAASESNGLKGLGAITASPSMRAALVELLGLYDAAKRPDDVQRLLDEVGIWGARDLGQLAGETDSMGTPLGLMAARSLRATGKQPAALAAVRAVIAQLPGHDPAYQLLVEWAGSASITELERKSAQDPFEERPWIWKAVAQLRDRQYQAAEESVRHAIAIDPSDGEQAAPDRMRAYAVLADVLAAKGDAQGAAGFRRAVNAIRTSERADEAYKLGLFQRAFAGYRAALDEFSDAYCIQSRLAVQLAKVGNKTESLKHYRRAFELMPDSFGRVESHCFGCESIFAGPTAQALADEVFAGLAKASNKPQTLYMLGYLRKEQKSYGEAADLFRQVVAMDRLYLNAWRQLNEVGEKTYLDAEERDIIRLRLFELDPQQRHVRYQLDEISDLSKLWHALTRAAQGSKQSSSPESVYPLAASVRAQEQTLSSLPPEMRLKMEQYLEIQASVAHGERNTQTKQSLANHTLLLAALRIMDTAVAAPWSN